MYEPNTIFLVESRYVIAGNYDEALRLFEMVSGYRLEELPNMDIVCRGNEVIVAEDVD